MISVIVPVYNAEKYIDRCIKSILAQTYTNWELILVDDGSMDNSLKKARYYEKSEPRIKVIHQENQGAGLARNTGLQSVSGDYVVFVDSDDYIESTYFELLSSHSEDVVFIDVNRRDENGNIVVVERLSMLKSKSLDEIIRGQMTGQVLWGGVRKAVKLSLLRENNICFSKHRIGEEAIYSFLLLYYANDYSFIDESVYNYEVHSNSLSQSNDEDPWGPVAYALRDKAKEIGCYDLYANTLNRFIIKAGIVSLDKVARNNSYPVFKKKAKAKLVEIHNNQDSLYTYDSTHMSYKAKLVWILLKSKLMLPVYCASRIRSLKKK